MYRQRLAGRGRRSSSVVDAAAGGVTVVVAHRKEVMHVGPNDHDKDDRDNHANQLNPENDAYWQSRGEDERPDDWEERIAKDDE